MIETKEEQERVILVGVELQDTENFEMSMEELASLAKTAGANVVNHYYQKRDKY
ncbi:GTPase HflX, partial [Streptococcus agalactiae]|nr:GTPase HflX [Streptococcus agalactiae]MCC9860381.1 GTPase HflX [Streptococcus agalactiae]MCD0144174.1 GTPase HflX [Streptococcus agalactiae]MCK6356898.1 GTPase HflX [Streptococcus agalactiae]